MTPEEAIKILNDTPVEISSGSKTTTREYNQMLHLAENSLEKQIPKKPRGAVQAGFFWCPDCVRAIKMKIEDSKINISYCPYCGQALDWRDKK